MTAGQVNRTLSSPAWTATRPLTGSGGSAVEAMALTVFFDGPSCPLLSIAVTVK